MSLNAVTLGAALLAGLLSFVSPCCLPLVPAYLSYITGVSVDQFAAQHEVGQLRQIAKSALAFVIGLALIFTLLGATATAVGQFLLDYQEWIARIAGALIIIFALQMLGVLHIRLLLQEKRLDFTRRRAPGFVGAMMMGSAFGIGWTPCVGPFLGSILLLASQSNTVGAGMLLLFVYALGLGLPFLAAGLLIGRLMPVLAGVRRYLGALSIASGVLLFVMGVLIMTNQLTLLTGVLVRVFGTGLAQ